MKDQNSTVCSLQEQKELPSPTCTWKTKTCSCSWLSLMLWYFHLMLIAKAESSSSGYSSSGKGITSPTENPLGPHIAVLFVLKPSNMPKVGYPGRAQSPSPRLHFLIHLPTTSRSQIMAIPGEVKLFKPALWQLRHASICKS